ncbi:MAG: DUF5331 domain-containing protein [Leptolyngbyaceae cyanobacterium CSU_1_4]|nr:DUF5331 domain-containing protein [Leptolyngbyaceae cyanobacterium CSU_1_4]
MDTEHLRSSLKTLWLDYYRSNRVWINRLGIWVTCEGDRRPSSSFILATLAILEPKLHEILPLIVDLSSNPDRIVSALGLNFNPDQALKNLTEAEHSVKMLPPGARALPDQPPAKALAEEKQKKAQPPAASPHADDYYPKNRRYQRRD